MTNQTIEDRAKAAAGAWQRWDSFVWWGRDKDIVTNDDEWALVMVATRDSGLLDLSNKSVIDREMLPFTETDPPTAMEQEFGNWLVGWTANYAIRVYQDGEITDAWRKWCDLSDRIDNYPILDENDYSERELNATEDNIEDAGKTYARRNDIDLPEGWQSALSEWLWANVEHAGEPNSGTDWGWYPGDDDIDNAFISLGWVPTDEGDEGEAERVPTPAELIAAGQIELGL